MTPAALWERLKAEGLVEGEAPTRERPPSPWYVRAMLGIAGWIGALFLIAFVGAAFSFILDDTVAAAAGGAACVAGAFLLFRTLSGNDFAEQFGLAVSLVGQILIGIGLANLFQPEAPVFYFAVAAMQAALVWAVPNFLHRVLTSGGASIALALGINQLSLHGLAAPLLCAALALVWLEPKLWAAGGRLWRPVGYGLVLALLLVETFRLFGAGLLLDLTGNEAGWLALYGPLIGRMLTAAVLVWVSIELGRRSDAGPAIGFPTLAAAAALVFGLVSLAAPGLASAVLVLLLGFAAGNRILAALGILALLGFVAHFYYSLHATLLEKSGILALTGLVLMAAHFLLLPRAFPPEADHA
ncbi:MAG TPA: DUF4401 domain-containing protein [Allosphingosinicella sp.]|nr:DUF4401 domain-containing protein [Allosphingosinicella sp.]